VLASRADHAGGEPTSAGGLVLVALGAVVLVLGWLASRGAATSLFTRRARLPLAGSLLAVSVVVVMPAVVVLRGVLGDFLTEVSLRFRWFYLQGAAQVAASHPVAGVGPAGFRDAYLLVRPPLSPEAVTSAHGILWDYVSTLGLAGAGAGLLWLWWLWLAGRRLAGTDETAPFDGTHASGHAIPGDEVRLLCLVAAAPMIVGSWIESAAATPLTAIAKLAGFAGWLAVGAAVADALRRSPALDRALVAGAVVLAAHAQLDVTAVTPGASCWFMLVFAALAADPGAARDPDEATGRATRGRVPARLHRALVAASCVGFITLTATGLVRTWRWESRLHAGAAALIDDRGLPERLPDRGMDRDARARIAASERLEEASRLWPADTQALRGASGLALEAARALVASGDPDRARHVAAHAEALAGRAAARPRGRATSHAWLGTVRAARAELFGDRDALAGAAIAWQTAARFDPRGPEPPMQLAAICQRQSRREDARRWARRALDLNEHYRLDPIAGLTPGQRARAAALAQ
jgi:hypothetical protein